MKQAWVRALLTGMVALASPMDAGAQVRVVASGAPLSMSVISLRDIPFRTTVRQQYDYSCGSAALATLLRFHYRKDVTEAAIFNAMYAQGDQAKIRKVGFSLLDMKKYLDRVGMASNGYRTTLDKLAETGIPAIGVISVGGYRHFVVIKGVRKNEVLVGDPAQGLKIYKRADFQAVWNGVAFAIDPAAQPTVAFNRTEEWRPWASLSLGEPLTSDSLESFTRDLPPIYQVARQIDGSLPR